MKKYFLIITLLISASLFGSDKCLMTRAAFDIGSGATKLKVASVDTCKNKIEKILLDTQIKIDYKEDLQKTKRELYSEKMMKLGEEKTILLKNEALKLGVKEFYAVATASMRTSKNGDEYIKELSRKLGFKIKVISQKEEGILGYIAASSGEKINPVVWDIGGGSMQIVFKEGSDFNVYEGKLASVSFKNYLVKEIQKKETLSPNPISKKEYESASKFAKKYANESVPLKIKRALSSHPVIGIGGVHYYSIGKRVHELKDNTYNLASLQKAISLSLPLSDSELKSEYAKTEVTNLILVEAFMDELKIKNVKVKKINLTDGLLILGNKDIL